MFPPLTSPCSLSKPITYSPCTTCSPRRNPLNSIFPGTTFISWTIIISARISHRNLLKHSLFLFSVPLSLFLTASHGYSWPFKESAFLLFLWIQSFGSNLSLSRTLGCCPQRPTAKSSKDISWSSEILVSRSDTLSQQHVNTPPQFWKNCQ